ncbi:MAG: iron ABC transporter permease [Actinomycetaceae bacterium]|nr:iron ABC transporter permease [Actinomycetaceae bacterium]
MAAPTLTSPNLSATAQVVAAHRQIQVRRALLISLLFLAAVSAFTVATVVGPTDLNVTQVIRGLVNPAALDSQQQTVLFRLRLPMSVMAVLVGAALSAAGAQMQTILANPLAEPFTLGISAAAAFGGAMVIVLGITLTGNTQFNLALVAWVSAMVATGIIVFAAIWRGASAETMILLGIGLVFLFQALLALIQYRASAEALQQIVFWSMGSLTRATWTGNAVLAVTLAVVLPIFAWHSWQLNALKLGEERALAMGVRVSYLRIITLVCCALLAATAVAFSGIIGFVGLVGPHIARMLVGEDQRYFLPAAIWAGAGMLAISHALSLTIIPGLAIPIGIVTALVGVPFFVSLVLTRRRLI